MAVLVIGGSTKDIGKTALMCGVIAALREFQWTAVKITAHDYEPASQMTGPAGNLRQTIQEETSAGAETDTARYLAAGARRALLVTRYGSDVAIDEIRRALGADRNVIFESNRIIDAVKPDVCLALVGRAGAGMKPSFQRLLRVADALVCVGVGSLLSHPCRDNATAWMGHPAPEGIARFELQSPDRLSPEMVSWLRERLNRVTNG